MLSQGFTIDEIGEYLCCCERGVKRMNILKAALMIVTVLLQLCDLDDE